MKTISLEQLLEAGCHFGHQVIRSNPKSRDFIYEARDGIHIIDLAKTKAGLEEAGAYVKKVAQNPEATIVVVGTKRQSSEILNNEIERVKKDVRINPNLHYVTNRWIGGLLTNFSEVSKNFKKLEDLTHKLETPSEQEGFTKKEIGGWQKEKEKLERLYGGVFTLRGKPDLLFIIDSHLEDLAVKEAIKMGVVSVAITDTNSDPTLIDYPIPANDDAVGSLELIIGYIMDAWIEGRNQIKDDKSSVRPASQRGEQTQDKNLKSEKKETEKDSEKTKKETKTEKSPKAKETKTTKTNKN